MPAKALLIRYPDGDFEYDFTRRALPAIGETMRRKGERWRVTRITGDSVPTAFVERAEGTQHLPPSGRM
jgi:hypothetical protein